MFKLAIPSSLLVLLMTVLSVGGPAAGVPIDRGAGCQERRALFIESPDEAAAAPADSDGMDHERSTGSGLSTRVDAFFAVLKSPARQSVIAPRGPGLTRRITLTRGPPA